jgi:hypothetical protein
MFAHMAFIYLHVVTHGFQELELLEVTITEAMILLQAHIPIHFLSAMVSPLFIIGSVASEGDEQFFRNIFWPLPVLNPRVKH